MEKDLLLKDKRISDDDLRHILFEFYNYCMDLDGELREYYIDEFIEERKQNEK